MNEGRFIKTPNGKDSNLFIRKAADLDGESFRKYFDEWEKGIPEGKGGVVEVLKQYSVEKTPEQEKVLSRVVEELEMVVKSYGLDRLDISKDPVLLLKDKFWQEYSYEEGITGQCFENLRTVGVRAKENLAKTELAAIAYHELLHLASFQRYSIQSKAHPEYPAYGIIKPERVGVSAVSGEDTLHRYFYHLNEAITLQLENQFAQRLRQYPEFQDEFAIIDGELGEYGKKAQYLSVEKNEEGKMEYVCKMTRAPEVETLNKIIKALYHKNRNEFRSEDEVFDVFAKAYFTGQLLPMARLLEKTYGKGFFRKVGEKMGKKMTMIKKKTEEKK